MTCKAKVPPRSDWGSWKQCPREAVTPGGFCRIHDPELKSARLAKRGPSKWERKTKLREQVVDFLEARLSKDDAARVLKAIGAAYHDFITPNWPLDYFADQP